MNLRDFMTILWWICLLILGLFAVWVYYNTEKICASYISIPKCECGFQIICKPCIK